MYDTIDINGIYKSGEFKSLIGGITLYKNKNLI